MEIKTDKTTIKIAREGSVFEAQTDTYIAWKNLDPIMEQTIEALTAEVEKAAEKLGNAITRANVRLAS